MIEICEKSGSVIEFPSRKVEQVLPRCIAMSGWKQSGKDTVADFLVREYGYRKASFASALKDMVSATYKIPREYMDSSTHKEMPLHNYPAISTDAFSIQIHEMLKSELSSGFWTPRAVLILEGSIKRAVNSNFWVRSVASEILSAPSNINYVISDMRYKSEADTLRILLPSLITMRLDRFDSIDTQDPSERDLDDYKFDIQLGNRGTVTDLQTTLGHVISTYSAYHERK